jgi:hypothetical protein
MPEFRAWTDYPFLDTDAKGQPAPIREVTVIAFDGDKYADVQYQGQTYNFKAGYLYKEPARSREDKHFTYREVKQLLGGVSKLRGKCV